MVEFLVKRRRFRIPRVSTASSWSKTEPCILVHAFLLRLRVVFHNDHPRIRIVWKSRVKFRTISLGRSRHAFRTSSIRRLNNERDEIQPSFSSVKKSFSFSLSLSLFYSSSSFVFPPLFSPFLLSLAVSRFRRESEHNKSSGFFHFDFAFYRVATLLPENKHFHG